MHLEQVLRFCDPWERICSYFGSHGGTHPLHKVDITAIDPHMSSGFSDRLPIRHVQYFPQKCHTRVKSIQTQAQPCNGRRAAANSSQALSSVSLLHLVAGLLGPQLLSVPVPYFFFLFTEMLPFVLPPFPKLFSL